MIGLCYLIFVDHRPKEYDKVIGSFSKYEHKAKRGRYSHRVSKIKMEQLPSWFHLEANGQSYGRVAKYFETVPYQTPVTLLVEKGAFSDQSTTYTVFKIIVNDSAIFNRVQEDAIISKTISLIKD